MLQLYVSFQIQKFRIQNTKSFVRFYVLSFDSKNVVLVMEKHIKAGDFGGGSVIMWFILRNMYLVIILISGSQLPKPL